MFLFPKCFELVKSKDKWLFSIVSFIIISYFGNSLKPDYHFLEMAPALSSSTLYEITFKNLENLA
jgi:hypothetical protein